MEILVGRAGVNHAPLSPDCRRIAVVLLYGLTVATGSSNVLSDYFWWIVALCGLLLLVLAAVLVRYVVLLMRDNSKSVFGSQIARRLVGDV